MPSIAFVDLKKNSFDALPCDAEFIEGHVQEVCPSATRADVQGAIAARMNTRKMTCVLMVSLLLSCSGRAQARPSDLTQEGAEHKDELSSLKTTEIHRPSVRRDPAAVSTITASLQLLGTSLSGSDSTLSITGRRIKTQGSATVIDDFSWIHKGRSFRSELKLAGSVARRVSVSASAAFSIQQNGSSTNRRAASEPRIRPVHLPSLMLEEYLANPKASLIDKGKTTIDGAPVAVVLLSLASDPKGLGEPAQTWYFSTVSGLPIRLEFDTVLMARLPQSIKTTVKLTDFVTHGALFIPHVVTTDTTSTSPLGQRSSYTYIIDDVKAGLAVTDSVFQETEQK